jgi:DNA-binding PadR family transcriptional regulator
MTKPVTSLGFALLGLIRDEPRSGYALRKVFETTPMGSYSSSPGSIYPALESLRKAGLVEARAEAGNTRGKGLFHLTPQGATAFEEWLAASVDGTDLSQAMLRFAFLHSHPDRSLTRAFLDSFEAAATAQVEALVQFVASAAGQAMPVQARVAVEHGRRQLEASAAWAAWALQTLEAEGELR